jgi:hypothetical protein
VQVCTSEEFKFLSVSGHICTVSSLRESREQCSGKTLLIV